MGQQHCDTWAECREKARQQQIPKRGNEKVLGLEHSSQVHNPHQWAQDIIAKHQEVGSWEASKLPRNTRGWQHKRHCFAPRTPIVQTQPMSWSTGISLRFSRRVYWHSGMPLVNHSQPPLHWRYSKTFIARTSFITLFHRTAPFRRTNVLHRRILLHQTDLVPAYLNQELLHMVQKRDQHTSYKYMIGFVLNYTHNFLPAKMQKMIR